MGEQLGLLKVIVVQGKRLVIRDFKTSDPYVVLKLGNQTKVINSCLNPIWNEELNFTLTKPLGVSNLVLQRKTEEAAMATKRLKELLEAHKSSSETLQLP
ncbi:protein C2-DOMAIN ABA-RELATED 11-like isoform X2 [Glycine soja]|uniref:protein C2-DOMAIN ABA-RELATED 11-like isoform X2 n=1 Tax=Glycine soja TaxID=3848 RepID=UPI001038B701|nr:protein C2-DOMAIN ABA-RELATED 11-like isoform X2 [Glycine soja]